MVHSQSHTDIEDIKVGKPEPCKIPAFTKYERCPGCKGKCFIPQEGSFSLKPCGMCRGKGKLPVSTDDGRWEKRKITL